jgi:hypothetical protein
MRFVKEPLLSKPIDNWTSADFVYYYSHKLEDTTGVKLFVPKDGWPYFAGRVKLFRNIHTTMSAAEYKDFIDNVMDILFTRKGAIPAFGAIVSNKVYNLFCSEMRKHSISSSNNADFIALRDKLLSDKSLTFSIRDIDAEYTQ